MKKLFSTAINLSYLHFWLLIFRVGVSGLLLTHGYPKALKLLDGNMEFGDPLGIGAGVSLVLAVFAEAVCSVLIILGLGTRLATIPIIITMATAAFIVHTEDPFGKQELPILYLLAFFTLLITGPGKYSLDQGLGKKGKK